ncbi:MAG: DNA polymerase III subunit delta' [Jatrophihabitans sp.]
MTVWDALVGQGETVEILRAAAAAAAQIAVGGEAASGSMTHAWLFTGPPGSGRSVAARAFAAALECTQPTMDGPGCGACSGCRAVLGTRHPDVHTVVPEGLSISVAEMRAVVGEASRRPMVGSWQAMIIEDADRLTEAASNALLKVVEEPPRRTVFLLCAPSTHPDDVAVTIRSRCRAIALRTPSAEAIAAVLRAEGVEPDMAQWAAQASQGHVGRARRLTRDEDARARRAAVLAVPGSLHTLRECQVAADALIVSAEAEAKAMSESVDDSELDALRTAMGAGGTGKGSATATRGMAGAVKDLQQRQKSRATRAQRDALDRALIDLAAFYRDVLRQQAGSGGAAAHPEVADTVATVAAAVTPAGALRRLDAVLACREALELNVKPRIAVEAMVAALRLP